MKRVLGFALLAGVASWALAQEGGSTKPQDKVDQLMQRIDELEKRVAELENSKKPVPTELGQQTPPQLTAPYSSNDYQTIQPRAFRINPKDLNTNPIPQIDGLKQELEDVTRMQRDDIPRNWSPRRFNGFTYYIVPLADKKSSGGSSSALDKAKIEWSVDLSRN